MRCRFGTFIAGMFFAVLGYAQKVYVPPPPPRVYVAPRPAPSYTPPAPRPAPSYTPPAPRPAPARSEPGPGAVRANPAPPARKSGPPPARGPSGTGERIPKDPQLRIGTAGSERSKTSQIPGVVSDPSHPREKKGDRAAIDPPQPARVRPQPTALRAGPGLNPADLRKRALDRPRADAFAQPGSHSVPAPPPNSGPRPLAYALPPTVVLAVPPAQRRILIIAGPGPGCTLPDAYSPPLWANPLCPPYIVPPPPVVVVHSVQMYDVAPSRHLIVRPNEASQTQPAASVVQYVVPPQLVQNYSSGSTTLSDMADLLTKLSDLYQQAAPGPGPVPPAEPAQESQTLDQRAASRSPQVAPLVDEFAERWHMPRETVEQGEKNLESLLKDLEPDKAVGTIDGLLNTFSSPLDARTDADDHPDIQTANAGLSVLFSVLALTSDSEKSRKVWPFLNAMGIVSGSLEGALRDSLLKRDIPIDLANQVIEKAKNGGIQAAFETLNTNMAVRTALNAVSPEGLLDAAYAGVHAALSATLLGSGAIPLAGCDDNDAAACSDIPNLTSGNADLARKGGSAILDGVNDGGAR